MIGLEGDLGLVLLLLAEPEESLDGGTAVGPVHPLARRPPLELGALRRLPQRFPGTEKRLDVHAVIDRGFGRSHDLLLSGQINGVPGKTPVYAIPLRRRE